MNPETELLLEVADHSSLNHKFDAECKKFFMNKEIIAPVLKEAVPEYRDCSIDRIIACIDGESIVSDPVDDVSAALQMKKAEIGDSALPTEMSSVTDKVILYDVRFKAVNPRLSTETIRFFLHIDLEVQNDYRPGYPVIKRATYYAAREISSQLGVLTNETNYGVLQKVYSIWICNENIPEKLRNTVTSYSIKKSDVIGTTDEPDADYDLMTVIIIRRGNDEGTEDIFDYLSGVFTTDIQRIARYVDVDRNVKIKEEFKQMSGLGMSIATKNYDKGMQQGMQQGEKKGSLKTLIELVQDKLLPIADAAKKANMSEKEFMVKMNEMLAET